MSLFYPTLKLRRVSEITLGLLEDMGVSALMLDADNTLTTHNNPVPAEHVLDWLEEMRAGGIKLVMVSNNNDQRVQPFAEILGLDYTAMACKPLTIGFGRAAARLGLPSGRIAVVGDQIFTDILGGNLFGVATILVEPIQPESGPFFRLKRKAEAGILRRYAKKGGKRLE